MKILKKIQKISITTIILVLGISIGFLVFNSFYPAFNELNAKDMYNRIIEERDYAINEAKLAGNYNCCIDPPCTMCFMEANIWNNFTPGTCACDDLIAQGKEACPQCRRGLDDIHSDENTSCDINSTISNCQSDIQ